jgi:CubicO group peptidase (beta-lactamase class C family)
MAATLHFTRGLAAALCVAAGSALAAAPAPLAEAAGRVMQEAASTARFNGAVVLMRDGAIVFEHAVGLAQREPDRPFTVDTPSDGGSLAKTMTAALMHEWVAEGRLSLDDPVTRHLPDYPNARHTVRDLVSHRSGLPDYAFFDVDFQPGQPRDTTDLLAVLARRKPPMDLPPGVVAEYSNLGFDLAALVLERVSGKKVGELWSERYFKRLGMQATYARPARFADWPGPRVLGYRFRNDAWELHDAVDGEGFIGASNVHASARDWARWGDAFARGLAMAPDRLQAGLREGLFDSGMRNRLTRLSWYCHADLERCHYTGAYNGFFSQVYWDRARREVVAYVSNGTLPPWRCAALTRDLVDVLAGRTPAPEPVQQPLRVLNKDIPSWAGGYSAPGLGPLAISSQGAQAFVRVGSGGLASIYPVGGGVFYAPMLDLWLGFSGTPEEPMLHLRSVFDTADAKRLGARGG